MFKSRKTGNRIIALIVCILFAALSIGVASPYFSSPQTHIKTINKLDEKKMDATAMTTAITIASLGLTAIKDDIATPIAEELADLTGPLMLIIGILFAEKFLLTTTSYISFTYLIPIACAFWGINIFIPKVYLRDLAYKIFVFAIAIVLLVPASVKLTVMVEETFDETINASVGRAKSLAQEIVNADTNEDAGFFKKLIEGIGDSITFVLDTGANVLSLFIDGIAVMLITTCAIPLLTLLFFLWVVRILFGLKIKMPLPPPRGHHHLP